MKFWQKSFFCVIALFLLGFDVAGYLLAGRSYALNEEYAVASAQKERQVIEKSLYDSISLSEKNFTELNPANLTQIIAPYADFYVSQGTYFILYQNDTQFFCNLPEKYDEDRFSINGEQLLQFKEIDGNLYCFIVSYLSSPYDALQYVYVKDMRPLTLFKAEIIRMFMIISVSVTLALAVIMLFLLIGLTRPLERLNTAAAEISKGNYGKRAVVASRDEVGDFARSFNLMADNIEVHIAELSRMTESKQTFIDNLAHEIRTPVTAILGYGELLKYANCSEAEKETAINHIIAQGKRIQNMAGKLMDLAYMSKENIEMLPIKLQDVFTDVKDALASSLLEGDITLRDESQPADIVGDAELIRSLFINLLDNAIKASTPGSIIEILTGRDGGGNVYAEIADHGKGMEHLEMDKVTEPFYRVDKSRSRNRGGAGLGLALCARICEIHGASLNITSEAGIGTTVRILFTTP